MKGTLQPLSLHPTFVRPNGKGTSHWRLSWASPQVAATSEGRTSGRQGSSGSEDNGVHLHILPLCFSEQLQTLLKIPKPSHSYVMGSAEMEHLMIPTKITQAAWACLQVHLSERQVEGVRNHLSLAKCPWEAPSETRPTVEEEVSE